MLSTQKSAIKLDKRALLFAIIALVAWPIRSPRAEPVKAAAPSLGTGFMIQIASQPLLLLVHLEPLKLRFVGKGARLPDDRGVYRPVRRDLKLQGHAET